MARSYIIEGLDRLGKDTLIRGIENRFGYHLKLHYSKPVASRFYAGEDDISRYRQYQAVGFQTMFRILKECAEPVICNRAHLGECVYAPRYRGYSGDYVFDIENQADADKTDYVRLVLLSENFSISTHFVDDGHGFASTREARAEEQELFLGAYARSRISDKRIICVTDPMTGNYRSPDDILDEAIK